MTQLTATEHTVLIFIKNNTKSQCRIPLTGPGPVGLAEHKLSVLQILLIAVSNCRNMIEYAADFMLEEM